MKSAKQPPRKKSVLAPKQARQDIPVLADIQLAEYLARSIIYTLAAQVADHHILEEEVLKTVLPQAQAIAIAIQRLNRLEWASPAGVLPARNEFSEDCWVTPRMELDNFAPLQVKSTYLIRQKNTSGYLVEQPSREFRHRDFQKKLTVRQPQSIELSQQGVSAPGPVNPSVSPNSHFSTHRMSLVLKDPRISNKPQYDVRPLVSSSGGLADILDSASLAYLRELEDKMQREGSRTSEVQMALPSQGKSVFGSGMPKIRDPHVDLRNCTFDMGGGLMRLVPLSHKRDKSLITLPMFGYQSPGRVFPADPAP